MCSTMQITFFLILSLISAVVVALPSGAPSCDIGESNVRSFHLSANRNPQTGPIQVGGFDVYLDGVKLKLRSATDLTGVNFYDVGVNHTVSLQSDTGVQFRGVLVILSSILDPAAKTREAAALLPMDTDTLELALGCGSGPAAGVSHSDNSLKSTAPMILRWDIVGDQLYLDVSVVTQNNASGSFYYYSQYVLEARGRVTIAPAAAPIAPPTAPIAQPTSPIAQPAAAPLAAAPTRKETKLNCGLFHGGVFCPRTLCGILGRALSLCKE